jgi:hypothetical protein
MQMTSVIAGPLFRFDGVGELLDRDGFVYQTVMHASPS